MHYEQAIAHHPDAADAWNNLAQVLYETQQWVRAKQAIDKAVVLGGTRLTRYKATQRAIEERM
jgi:Tfp pilus assembly protein PilF